ncbi:nitrate reductase molybdenum cofactor assembly chaperone [Ornithinimicrobium pekingense]|uniref:Nitrate reductase molybdenum cofactor assembly chaperone n=1 Tax=Ornithinimicrobium pekingense TaxID=384677 RepID=A0ABQ2F8P5_9MICO|nr:nitrate reductase molybdenum cofactor assembly chaperone [Ornithinimicrobium pekingense]GGK72317.1 nitrate reductase molybdenum cofactor assembly chaperone [Ornithinimicrobium pekingense]
MMPWRRHRRTSPRFDARAQADTWQLCSLLLDYPGEDLPGRLPVLREVVAGLPRAAGEPLGRFLDHVQAVGLPELQRDYVDTFDVTRKCALHLTYFLHGDTRNRGVALVQFKQLYRQHGVELDDADSELPDFLPVVLEFGATVAPDTAWKVLNDHRVGIELLRRALDRRGSPWLDVVAAVRATLPALDGDDEQALAALIAQGPPQETVGIDDAPYAMDPALDGHTRGAPPPVHPPNACGGGAPHSSSQSLGPTIPVGAPR